MSQCTSTDNIHQRLRPLLLSVLPSPDNTRLLKACLSSGLEASNAWEDWLNRVGNPKSWLERDYSGLKGLLPFIQHALTKNRIELSEEFRTYLRVSTLREELRSEIYRNIAGEVLSTLQSAGLQVIALKGAALSETVYDHPNIRHNHAIDLLLHESDLPAAVEALKSLPFVPSPQQSRAHAQHQNFIHETGLPLTLHSRLFFLPYYDADQGGVWDRAESAYVGEVKTLVCCAADNLVHVCGHASYSRSRSNLRWVCDAFYILKRRPSIDWNIVVQEARNHHLVIPLKAILEYLAKELQVEIPEYVLTELSKIPLGEDSADCEAVLAIATMGISPFRALSRLSGSWRAKLLIAKFMLFPPKNYVRWRYGVSHPMLTPLVYIYRPCRFLFRRILRVSGLRQPQ